MDSALILIIIGLVIAVNALLTALIVAKWKINAFRMMHDIEETRSELHCVLQDFSGALNALGKANADSSNEAPSAAGKTKKQENRQPIGFRTTPENPINKK